jgi:hypothetical protein
MAENFKPHRRACSWPREGHLTGITQAARFSRKLAE